MKEKQNYSTDKFNQADELFKEYQQAKKPWFIKLLIPLRCAFCGKILPMDMDSEPLCDKCKDALEHLRIKPPFCPVCGLNKGECSHTGKEKRYFEQCVSPFYYDGIVRAGILRVKFSGSPSGCEYFGIILANEIRCRYNDVHFDLAIPVPMHKVAMRNRGFNQSNLIAKSLCKATGIPLCESVLVKKIQTLEQHKVGAMQRVGNVFGVFDVANKEKIKDKTVLLVDDVSTTGSTLDECSKMLMIYGAKKVYCITLAKSKPKLVK